ncbi:MAG: IS200/IS605 family transposase [Desulfobulbus sp.]|nr:IS200/IS605 family transposase [Desulfobulbus sp.]
MYDEQSLSHAKRDCKYHVIWISKYRKKHIFGDLRKYLGEIFRELAKQKKYTVIEGHLMPDHVHILLSMPPKYSFAQIAGFIKGKSAIPIARNFQGRKKNFVGRNFWAQGYYVSTVGKDEDAVMAYIQHQEKEDKRLDPLNLFEV